MIKKTLFILTLGFSFQGQINARAVLPTDSIKQTHLLHQEEILKPLEPTLLPNEVAYSNWKSNSTSQVALPLSSGVRLAVKICLAG